jgi:hypothetical protein
MDFTLYSVFTANSSLAEVLSVKSARRKRHISNNTSQTSKKSAKPDPTSAAVTLPPKSVLTHFFPPLRTTVMDMETTDTEYTLPKQEVPRKPGKLPPIMITSITNLIRIQSDLKDHVKG